VVELERNKYVISRQNVLPRGIYKESNDVNECEFLELANLHEACLVVNIQEENYEESVERELKEVKDCMERIEKGLLKMRECILNALEKKSDKEGTSTHSMSITPKKRKISLEDLLHLLKTTKRN